MGREAQLFIQAAEAGPPAQGWGTREASRPPKYTGRAARVSLLPLSPEGAPGLEGSGAEALAPSISRHRHLH